MWLGIAVVVCVITHFPRKIHATTERFDLLCEVELYHAHPPPPQSGYSCYKYVNCQAKSLAADFFEKESDATALKYIESQQ